MAAVVGVLMLAGVAAAGVYVYRVEHQIVTTIVDPKTLKPVLTPTQPQEPYNVLLLGVDQRPGETQSHSDTILVAHIDPQTKHVWLLSIPRDTKVDIPGHGVDKITVAHFVGGPALSIQTVEGLTGLKINHYLEVSFTGFKRAVDALGGVWVDVPYAIDDKDADRSPGHRAAKVPKGYHLLDGDHALTFVRARHQFADQDFTRMRDQQLFIKALATQMARTSSITKIPAAISAIAPYIRTDMGMMDMLRTGLALRDMGGKNVYSATVLGVWKTPYIYPDETLMAELVNDIKTEQPFDKTKAAANDTAEPGSTTSSSTIAPSTVSITVRNGEGVSGAANQAASILKAKGFKVPTVGNAKQATYPQTLVVYKKNSALAQAVAQDLMPNTKIVKGNGTYSFKTDVLVVIGKDWDASQIPVAPATQ